MVNTRKIEALKAQAKNQARIGSTQRVRAPPKETAASIAETCRPMNFPATSMSITRTDGEVLYFDAPQLAFDQKTLLTVAGPAQQLSAAEASQKHIENLIATLSQVMKQPGAAEAFAAAAEQ